MTDYMLYGMRIRTDIPLLAIPLLQTVPDAAVDLVVEAIPAIPAFQGEMLTGNDSFSIRIDRSNPVEWLLRYQRPDGWMDVALSSGRIAYCCSTNICQRDVGRVIAPAVLAIYALMLNRPMLHGAMLEIDGRGLALLGLSEAGKSTTTAALVAAGCRLVTEEMILFPTDQTLNLAPGLPLISLSPYTVPYLPSPLRLAPLFREAGLARSKLLWLLPPAAYIAPQESVPLSAIFLLDGRLAADMPPCYQPIAAETAMSEILPHAYWSKLQHPDTLEVLRKTCAPLVQGGRCGRLNLPSGVDKVFQQGPTLKAMLRGVMEDIR